MKTSVAFVSIASLALVKAVDDCLSTCEQTAADSLGCDLTDVAGCLCQSAFATKAKACLYETDGCGSTYVSEMYNAVNSACADVTVTATTSAAAAATSTSGSADCIASCESTAASSLGCDVSDLAGCFCLADFATAAKACLYENSCSSDVSGFYSEYNSACADVSAATSAVAATTTAAAAQQTSAAQQISASQQQTSVAGETSAAPYQTSAAGASSVATALTTSYTAGVVSNGTASPTGYVTAGASALCAGGMSFVMVVAAWSGVAALF